MRLSSLVFTRAGGPIRPRRFRVTSRSSRFTFKEV